VRENVVLDEIEYRELKALRRRTARINLVLVDGV